MKKIIIGLAGLLFAIMLCGGIKEIAWRFFYTKPMTTGYTVTSNDADIETASREWFEQYADGLSGWKVPYRMRVRDAWIDEIEILEPGYVLLNYTVCPSSTNSAVISNLGLISTEYRNRYFAQKVLHWGGGEGGWLLAETMTPVQYQIQSSEFAEEIGKPQTQHYAMNTDEPMTYVVRDEQLFVTYDSGAHLKEVPDGYEKICREMNDTYNELLEKGSYIIRPEFTAFVAYGEGGCSLVYSTDEGENWQESVVDGRGFKANTFLSKTADACYVTFACDRSLGSDYYATYVTRDYQTWENVRMPEGVPQTNLTMVYWAQDGNGYYAKSETPLYKVSADGTFLGEIRYPEEQNIVNELGYHPFDSAEYMYEEDGVLYLVVGQGDDGDYSKDGKLQKALYKLAEDGSGFIYVKEIADTTEPAG